MASEAETNEIIERAYAAYMGARLAKQRKAEARTEQPMIKAYGPPERPVSGNAHEPAPYLPHYLLQ